MKNKYTILIGSVARGKATKLSDIDIVEIGAPFEWDTKSLRNARERKIVRVQYSYKRFKELYGEGSLFLYHIFNEGVLLEGDSVGWQALAASFKVRKRFAREVSRSRMMLEFLLSDEQNASAPVAFLSNALRGLKQIAICRLAESGEYVFDKRAALRKFYAWLPAGLIATMLEAEYIISRDGAAKSKRDLNAAAVRLMGLCRKHRKELA